MADGVTLSWRGERYEIARHDGAEAKPDRGSVWQVTRGGAPITSFPAQPGEGAEAARARAVEWLEANADRPTTDVGRQ